MNSINRGEIKKVLILMSTYNGEKYIETQIDSLINQDYQYIDMLIRDDGSTDNTVNILERMEEKYNHIRVIKGTNIGVTRSFFSLLQRSNDYDYYSFCDQDDFWKPDKISRSIQNLEAYDSLPAMYCSSATLVDKNLKFMGKTPNKTAKWENSFIENIAIGCTILINKRAKDLLSVKQPKYALLHDTWIYLVISNIGKVIYDPISTINYRQHESNVVGIEKNKLKSFIYKVIKMIKNNNFENYRRQAKEFVEIYGESIPPINYTEILNFINKNENLLHRVKYISKTKLIRQRKFDTLMFKLLILCGK